MIESISSDMLAERKKVIENDISVVQQRLQNYEAVLDCYIEMNKDQKKFRKFLDKKSEENGKHKQEEHKSS